MCRVGDQVHDDLMDLSGVGRNDLAFT